MFVPNNEMGVVVEFCKMADRLGWKLVSIGAIFPDAVFEHDDELWRIEFEYASSNFVAHGHDCRDCDLIVCWVHDWTDCPLPVLAISEQQDALTLWTKSDSKDLELYYWRSGCLRAEKQVKDLIAQVSYLESIKQPSPESAHKFDLQSVFGRLDDGSRDALTKILQAINDGRVTSAADAAKAVDANKTKVYEMFRLANAVGAIYMNGDGAYHVRQ